MSEAIPTVVNLSAESSAKVTYENHVVAAVNDHVVRISIMTEPYYWHSHPNSDETFLSIEGGLLIEFESGVVTLEPGQMVTVRRGVRHRTRPLGARSVNLTFEASSTETVVDQ